MFDSAVSRYLLQDYPVFHLKGRWSLVSVMKTTNPTQLLSKGIDFQFITVIMRQNNVESKKTVFYVGLCVRFQAQR